jgi:ADP-ribosylglycohydrolase
MLGAIIGDVVGSVFEGSGLKIKQFPLLTAKNTYTDDTVLTVAVASAILDQGDYSEYIRKFARVIRVGGMADIFSGGFMMTR